MPWSVPGFPSSREPLHPFIFVFKLITVTFTSPLHLINSWELFWGDVIAAVEHGIGRFVFYWLIQVASCLGFGHRLALLFWLVLLPWERDYSGNPVESGNNVRTGKNPPDNFYSCNFSGCRTGLFHKIVLMVILCGRMVFLFRLLITNHFVVLVLLLRLLFLDSYHYCSLFVLLSSLCVSFVLHCFVLLVVVLLILLILCIIILLLLLLLLILLLLLLLLLLIPLPILI